VNRSTCIDGLVFLFSAVDGVEPQSETNWRLADQYRVPVLVLLKWIDKDLTLMVCQQVRDMLKSNAVAITLPIGEENDFRGVVDLVKKPSFVWHEEGLGATFDIVPIPEKCLMKLRNTDRFY
jgi:elongation factor G